MTTQDRIAAILVSLGVVGATLVGTSQVCVDENGLTMFPEFALVIEDVKTCFASQQQYDTYADDVVLRFNSDIEDEGRLALFGETAPEFYAVLKHKIEEDGGTLAISNYTGATDALQVLMDYIQ